MENEKIMLKCGCMIHAQKFIVGKQCKDRNCSECKIISQIHPFGEKRLLDLLMRLEND